MSVSQADFRAQAKAFLAAATAYNVLAQNAGGPDVDFQVASDNLATVSADLGIALFMPTPVYAASTITGCANINQDYRPVTSLYYNSWMTAYVLQFYNSNPDCQDGLDQYTGWSVKPTHSNYYYAQFSGSVLTLMFQGTSLQAETIEVNDGTDGGPFFLPMVVY